MGISINDYNLLRIFNIPMSYYTLTDNIFDEIVDGFLDKMKLSFIPCESEYYRFLKLLIFCNNFKKDSLDWYDVVVTREQIEKDLVPVPSFLIEYIFSDDVDNYYKNGCITYSIKLFDDLICITLPECDFIDVYTRKDFFKVSEDMYYKLTPDLFGRVGYYDYR